MNRKIKGAAAVLTQMLLAFTLSMGTALAATGAPDTSVAKRSKVIDFEDEVVEGLNKRPLDSLSQISEKEKRKRKLHLYRKRAGFRSETAETTKAVRYTP